MGTENQKRVFQEALRELGRRKIPFAVGGSLAAATYTGQNAPVKDLDVYVTPKTSADAIRVLNDLGLEDYFHRLPYQRHWIYRAVADDAIVDVIWAMANSRAEVDEEWICRGRIVNIEDEHVRVVPLEELIWSKLYVLQYDRCDWPEIVNLVLAAPDQINWPHLLERLEDDAPLLDALLTVAAWIDPEVRGMAALPREESIRRAALLDTRPWLKLKEKTRLR